MLSLLLYNNTAYVNGNFVVCKHFKCQLLRLLTFIILRSHSAVILALYQATKSLPPTCQCKQFNTHNSCMHATSLGPAVCAFCILQEFIQVGSKKGGGRGRK